MSGLLFTMHYLLVGNVKEQVVFVLCDTFVIGY